MHDKGACHFCAPVPVRAVEAWVLRSRHWEEGYGQPGECIDFQKITHGDKIGSISSPMEDGDDEQENSR